MEELETELHVGLETPLRNIELSPVSSSRNIRSNGCQIYEPQCHLV